MRCNTCANERYCYDGNHQLTRDCCADDGFAAYTPITNADSIRAMTDEKLAHLLQTAEEHIFSGNLWNYKQWLSWLKSPVELED